MNPTFLLLQLPRLTKPSCLMLGVQADPGAESFQFVACLGGPPPTPDELKSPLWRLLARGEKVREVLSRVGERIDWDATVGSLIAQYEAEREREALLGGLF